MSMIPDTDSIVIGFLRTVVLTVWALLVYIFYQFPNSKTEAALAWFHSLHPLESIAVLTALISLAVVFGLAIPTIYFYAVPAFGWLVIVRSV